jgi:hypothetical protein
MKRVIMLLAFVLLFFVGTALASSGGTYVLDWFRIGGSGGTMSGGAFSLVGTLGQAEGGVLSGGSYSLAGGFLGEAGSSTGNNVFLPVIIKN